MNLPGSSLSVRTRGLLLMPAGALAVHQLRYVLAYGSHAPDRLAAQGHGYLNSLGALNVSRILSAPSASRSSSANPSPSVSSQR